MPEKKIHNSSSLSSIVCPVINIYMYISSSSPKKRVLNKDASPLKAVCATNNAAFQLRKFCQWLGSVVLLQHQPGLQGHQNHVVSPGSSCKLEAHSRLPVCHPSHLPAALGGSRFCLGSGCPETSSASAVTLLGETLHCLDHCQSRRSNTDCPDSPSIQVQLPLIHVRHKSNSTKHNLLRPQAHMKQCWGRHRVRVGTLCYPLRDEHSVIAQNTRFRSSSMAISLTLSLSFRWAPRAWPQQQLSCDKSDRPIKNQTGASCPCSSATLRDTIPCSCSAPAFKTCVQMHVLLCEKQLCVTAKNYHVSLSSQLPTLGSKRHFSQTHF